jgi:hypothetical protein
MGQVEKERVISELLQELPEGGSSDFFASLVTRLAKGLEADCVLLLEMTQGRDEARTLASWGGGEIVPGTIIARADLARERLLERMQAKSCIGADLRDSTGCVLGLLALLWRNPEADARLADLGARVAVARAAAEIERRRLEQAIGKLSVLSRATPHPVLELSGDGALLFHNEAATILARSLGCDDPIRILPRDTAGAVRKCLVTGKNGIVMDTPGQDRTLVWSFIPIPKSNSVFAQAFELTLFLDLHEELRGSRATFRPARPEPRPKAPGGRAHRARLQGWRVH